MQQLGSALQEVKEKLERIRANRPEQYVSPFPPRPKVRICPTCKFELEKESDHGWVRAGIDAYTGRPIYQHCPTCSKHARVRLETAQQADLVSRLFEGTHIPHTMRYYTFETYPPHGDQNAFQVVKGWVTDCLAGNEDVRHGLYLGGQVGRGKSGLAVCALKEALSVGQTGLFVLTMELLHRIRSTFHADASVSHDVLLEVVTKVPWLVLDDLAVERPTEFVIEQLYYIIEQRRMRGLFTIFTSNLSTRELEQYWRPKSMKEGEFHPGVRVVERIREYAVGVIVQGENLRAGDW